MLKNVTLEWRAALVPADCLRWPIARSSRAQRGQLCGTLSLTFVDIAFPSS